MIIKSWYRTSDNKNLANKWVKKISVQLGFSFEIKVPQLGSARLGAFLARLGSSWKIPARAHHYKIPYNSEWFWSHCDFYYCWKPTTTVLLLLFVVVSNTADTVTRQEVFRHDPLIPIEGYCCAPSSTLENTVNNHSNLRFQKQNKFFVA